MQVCLPLKGVYSSKNRACKVPDKNLSLINSIQVNKYNANLGLRNEYIAKVIGSRSPIPITEGTYRRWKNQGIGSFDRSKTVYLKN